MEELNDEVGKVKEGLSKVISDASDIVMDRFKNPYITSFSISWIVFNWKPVAFFIFSNGNVEYKIFTIKQEYSDVYHYFYYPLVSAIVFLFLIPYLNMINERFLKYAIKKRADYINDQIVDNIERKTIVAIAEDKEQLAIKNAREGAGHNKYVDSLNSTIKQINDTLNQERLNNIENVQLLQNQNKELAEKISEQNKELVEEQKRSKYAMDDAIADYQINAINEFKLQRLNNRQNKIINLKNYNNKNSYHILEYFTSDNLVLYYDLVDLKFKDILEIRDLMNTLNYEYIFEQNLINEGVNIMNNHN